MNDLIRNNGSNSNQVSVDFFNRSLSPTINVKQLIEARESMPWSIFRIHIHVQPSNR